MIGVGLAALALVSASCAGAPGRQVAEPEPSIALEPARPLPPPAPPSLAPWAGRYALTGQVLEDGCHGAVLLAAGEIEIDAVARTLYADAVDREYDAALEGGALVATGRFPAATPCAESTLYERWELERAEGGALEGELASTWLMWPGCMRVCTIRFGVRGEPR